jgi:carbonic anhydrase
MRLFEAILEANHCAVAGDPHATVAVGDFADALPLAALTCIDARLNRLLPSALGVPEEQFIWLRNAGNIVTGSMSSTLRSLALACAVKGAKEIVILGHTDCLVGRTTTLQLLNRLAALGVDRQRLPDNLQDFFGMFGSERQNVIKATDFVRRSPLIGPKVPVHGLLIDLQTGRLESIVNGYDTFNVTTGGFSSALKSTGQVLDAMEEIGRATVGEIQFPETRIGEGMASAKETLQKADDLTAALTQKRPPSLAASAEPGTPPAPPKLPHPKPSRFNIDFRQYGRPR